MKTAIMPTRDEDYAQWYQEVVKASDLAENSPVRGCMVIKPWGYAIWENIRTIMDRMFKESGVKNAYFPLFIPLSFLEKEAEHVEGFAKECAVVTHHRLEKGPNGGLVPAGPLAEPLVVRPTSETIIGDLFAKWTKSYRDLPILINQWANVVRWEMRTRLFLRTTEFLWQEGHTVHSSKEEAEERTLMMLDVYEKFARDYLAIPVITGRKTAGERFPGAVDTFCMEAMMQDRKALQFGTSHFLGQNFSKAAEIKFQTVQGTEEYAWTTSWGVSTRMIGGMIMAHSDDDGLVLPPRVASSHVVLMPIIKREEDRSRVMDYTKGLAQDLKNKFYVYRNLEVEIDTRDVGGRAWDWIKKGIPVRVEIGPKEVDQKTVFVGRRDKSPKDKAALDKEVFKEQILDILEEIQQNILVRAKTFKKKNTVVIDEKQKFYDFFTPQNKQKPEIHGGFVLAHWCTNEVCENKINEDLSVTIRSVPLTPKTEKGKCIYCGKDSTQRVVFAKAY